MIRIDSPANAHVKRWTSLSKSANIRKQGEFILMGEKLVREFLKDPGPWKIRAEIVPEGGTSLLESSRGSRTAERPPLVAEVKNGLFREIDALGVHFNLLALELPEIPAADLRVPPKGAELICPLGDPGNLGAVARSALAFGASKLILTEESALPFHPKAIKASAGALLKLPIVRAGALKTLAPAGPFFALDQGGEDIAKVSWPKDFRLAVGEEGPGLPAFSEARRVSIPTHDVESLNATVAASLALYRALV